MDRKTIIALRVNKRLNQFEFSKLLGISRPLLAQIEAGYISPSQKVTDAIYRVLDANYIGKVRELVELGE